MRNVLCLICLLCVLWGWLGGAELTNAGQFTALAPGRCGEPYLTRPTHSIIMCAAMCSSNGDSCDAFSVGHEATGDGGKGRACELVTLGSLQASPTTAAIAEDVYYKCYVTKTVSDLFTTPPPTSTTTPTPTSAALSTITTDRSP
ncbi:uncharacterized protein LOC126993886 [Eriocheir sinensis]|uniref:uncharacterized protein LOC126993886 n=1 Tax=Eriocheir sinensis TaxID=95602 RepID=UPI0021CAAA82|nr:uncharacterized protein LOC126993886 [Eriocheir sinensis]